MAEKNILFEMRNITKTFPGVVALDNATLQVREGEIHGLIGENGAGKSTLMKILSGTYPTGTYDGEIWLKDQKLVLNSPNDALLKGIGVVPQELSVVNDLTVAENIAVGLWIESGRLVNLRHVTQRIRDFLDDYHFAINPAQTVSKLTAAQKQEVMIARALYRKPSILILDEPTSSLSLHEVQNLFHILNDLRERGVTCIFITHKLGEIFELTDRTTVLRDGIVAGEFDRDEFDENVIVTAMVGRSIDKMYPTRDSKFDDEAVLRVEDLTIEHPTIANRNLVEGVSFHLRRGEILGIAGLVGAGRSEVLNAIYGRLARSSGVFFVDGQEIRVNNTNDAKAAGIALVTEDRKSDGLLPDLPIRPNITANNLDMLQTLRVFLNKQKEVVVAQEYVDKLSIRTPSIESLILNLSGGNQQKVVIGRVLMGEPKILLLDEPTKGVDVGAKNEIYKIMYDLVKDGISIIMVSSELPELLAICDRFVVLASGKIQDEFEKSEASEQRVMLAATEAMASNGTRVSPPTAL